MTETITPAELRMRQARAMPERGRDGYRIHVEPMGYRSWMCALYQGDSERPFWGVFGIRTSSERVAKQRCREEWEAFRAGRLGLEESDA